MVSSKHGVCHFSFRDTVSICFHHSNPRNMKLMFKCLHVGHDFIFIVTCVSIQHMMGNVCYQPPVVIKKKVN